MWKYTYSSELYHYGVKGMKWGIRRSKEELRYNRNSIVAVLSRRLKDVKTPNGVQITSVSVHALDRIENRDDRKVSAKEIVNALNKPIHIGQEKIDSKGRSSIRYIGKNATANVNPKSGVITTVWKTGSKERKKYLKK